MTKNERLARDLREAFLREPHLLCGYTRENFPDIEQAIRAGDPANWGSGGARATILHEWAIQDEFGYNAGRAIWEAYERVRDYLDECGHDVFIESVNGAVSLVYDA